MSCLGLVCLGFDLAPKKLCRFVKKDHGLLKKNMPRIFPPAAQILECWIFCRYHFAFDSTFYLIMNSTQSKGRLA